MKKDTTIIKSILFVFGALALLTSVTKLAFAQVPPFTLIDPKVDTTIKTDTKITNDDNTTNAAVTTSARVDVVPGTSSGLRAAVDSVIMKVESGDDSNICDTIKTSVNSLSADERASLAWKSDSYERNLKLDASATASEEDKAMYESLLAAYKKLSTSVWTDSSVDSTNKAAIRGSYLDLMAEYRNGDADPARANKIRNFLNKAAECLTDSAIVKTAVGASTDTTVAQDATITVTQDDVTEEDAKQGMPVAASVRNKPGLQTFLKLTVANDSNIKSVTTDENQTETVYKQRGRLLGFIPMWMNVKVAVNADQSATVKYPWYTFMTHAKGGKLTSEAVLEKVTFSKGETLSTTDQAIAVYSTQRAFDGLQAEAEVKVDAETETSADTSKDTKPETETSADSKMKATTETE